MRVRCLFSVCRLSGWTPSCCMLSQSVLLSCICTAAFLLVSFSCNVTCLKLSNSMCCCVAGVEYTVSHVAAFFNLSYIYHFHIAGVLCTLYCIGSVCIPYSLPLLAFQNVFRCYAYCRQLYVVYRNSLWYTFFVDGYCTWRNFDDLEWTHFRGHEFTVGIGRQTLCRKSFHWCAINEKKLYGVRSLWKILDTLVLNMLMLHGIVS